MISAFTQAIIKELLKARTWLVYTQPVAAKLPIASLCKRAVIQKIA